MTTASANGPKQLAALLELIRQSGVGVVDAAVSNKQVVAPVSPAIGINLQAAEVRNVAAQLASGQTFDLNTLLASAVTLAGGHPDPAKLAAAASATKYALIDTPDRSSTSLILAALMSVPVSGNQPDGNLEDIQLNALQFAIVWHMMSTRLLERSRPAKTTPPVATTPEGLRSTGQLAAAAPGSCVEKKEINEIFNGYAASTLAAIVANAIDFMIEIELEEVESGTSPLQQVKAANALIDAALPIAMLIMTKRLFHADVTYPKDPLVRTKGTDQYLDTETLTTTAGFDPVFKDKGDATNCISVFVAALGKDFELPNQGAGGPAKGIGTTWALAKGGLDAGTAGVSDRGFVQFCLASCGFPQTHTDEAGKNQIELQGLPQHHDKTAVKTSYNRKALIYTTFDPFDLEGQGVTFWKNMQAAVRAAIPFLTANPIAGTSNAVSTMLLRAGLLRSPMTAVPVLDWSDEYLLAYRVTDRFHVQGPVDGAGMVGGDGTVTTDLRGNVTMEASILLRPSKDDPQHLTGTGAVKVTHASESSTGRCVYGRSRNPDSGELADCNRICEGTSCKSGITEESHVTGSTPGQVRVDIYLSDQQTPGIIQRTQLTTLTSPTLIWQETRVSPLGTEHLSAPSSDVWDGSQLDGILHPYRWQPNWTPGDFPALVAKATGSDLQTGHGDGYTETWQLITDDQN